MGLVVCLLLFVSACGGTSETVEVNKTAVSTTTTVTPTSTTVAPTTTTVASTTTVAPSTTTLVPTTTTVAPSATVIDFVASGPVVAPMMVVDFEGGSASFEDGDWGGEDLYGSGMPIWEPVIDTEGCENNSNFFAEELSPRGKRNIELIFGKSVNEIIGSDIREMKQLKFQVDEIFENDNYGLGVENYSARYLESYEGLEYLTCLQWLDLDYLSDGRDHRFLSSLTELRYLNLTGFNDFENVKLLKPMSKLETLVLPAAFKSLPELAQLESLRRIDARASNSCDIGAILELPRLEKLLIGSNSIEGSDYQTYLELEESRRNFDLSASPDGKYLELLIPGGSAAFNQEWDYSLANPSPENGWGNKGYMMDLVQSIYEIVDDSYDEIVFVGNATESSASYVGMAKQISNNTPGLGAPVWSSASCFGSGGRLRGLITLPTKADLIEDLDVFHDGQLVHETLHLWGGGNLLPRIEGFNGNISGGHWSVTSAGGILGGFDLDTLETVGDSVYKADYFDPVGSGGLIPMSSLELYMMGVLPADELSATVVFRGVSETNPENSCVDYGYEWWEARCFKAKEKYEVTVEEIVEVFGERPYEGKKEISVLVVAVSEDPLTASDWSLLDEKIVWNAQTSDNGIEANNIWEASGGKVTFIFPAAASG